MRRGEYGYQIRLSWDEFSNNGGYMVYRSSRFIPKIYWTIFGGLFLFIAALVIWLIQSGNVLKSRAGDVAERT